LPAAPLDAKSRRYAGRVDPDYSPEQVAELLASDEIQLIDVREQHEYQAGRIGGARLIQLAELAQAADTIGRDKPIVFYCRSGARSAMASDAFRGVGYDAHNMTGGLLAWDAAGLPLEPDEGYVAPS